MPSTLISTTSPGRMGPMPEGVPVAMTSPGSRVMIREMKETRVGTAKDQVTGVAVLPALAVQVAFHREVIRVGNLGFNPGPQGREGVEALGAGELAVLFLQIPGGDVVDAGVAQDVVPEVRFLDVPGGLADDHRQFRLVVHPAAHLGIDNVFVRADHRGAGLHEDQGFFGDGVAEFGGVIPVIQADGHDLGRLAGRQQRHLRQGDDFPGGIGQAAVIGRAPQDLDLFAFQEAVPRPALHFKA